MKYPVITSIILALFVLFFAVAPAFAGIPEVVAAQAAVDAAKEQLAAAKKGLTKREKAELAVLVATARLSKIDNK